jgi:hypothetical protein
MAGPVLNFLQACLDNLQEAGWTGERKIGQPTAPVL